MSAARSEQSAPRTERRLTLELEPVAAALLEQARAESAAIRARGEQEAGRCLAEARARAEEIRALARDRGTAQAAAGLAADRSRARREARAAVLAARREAYDALGTAAHRAALRLRDEPGYPALRAALDQAARRVLGPGTQVREAPDGGVVGELGDRRLDLSLAGFAERAVRACAAELERTT